MSPEPVRDPTEYTTLVERFANTYSGTEERSGWETVQLYNRVAEYCADHPNKGSQAVSTALDVPRPAIRRWVDGDARPHVVRGLDTAEDRRWFDLRWTGNQLQAISELVAWVFSSGSLKSDRHDPKFVVDDEAAAERLAEPLETLDVEPVLVDRDEWRPQDVRGEEVTCRPDGSVLGRVLACLGAPVGKKRGRRDFRVPPYLTHPDCPYYLKRGWLRTYVRNRAREDPSDSGASWAESRSTEYLDELAVFARTVTGEKVVYYGDLDIRFSKAAVEALGLDRELLNA